MPDATYARAWVGVWKRPGEQRRGKERGNYDFNRAKPQFYKSRNRIQDRVLIEVVYIRHFQRECDLPRQYQLPPSGNLLPQTGACVNLR